MDQEAKYWRDKWLDSIRTIEAIRKAEEILKEAKRAKRKRI